jgi:hypothetical protein
MHFQGRDRATLLDPDGPAQSTPALLDAVSPDRHRRVIGP